MSVPSFKRVMSTSILNCSFSAFDLRVEWEEIELLERFHEVHVDSTEHEAIQCVVGRLLPLCRAMVAYMKTDYWLSPSVYMGVLS